MRSSAKILGMYGMAKAAIDQLVRNLIFEIGQQM
jgi:hypothetical protein